MNPACPYSEGLAVMVRPSLQDARDVAWDCTEFCTIPDVPAAADAKTRNMPSAAEAFAVACPDCVPTAGYGATEEYTGPPFEMYELACDGWPGPPFTFCTPGNRWQAAGGSSSASTTLSRL